jgi:hypothetical protein
MFRMAVARIAAIALGILPCTILAQQSEMGTVTVTISDQSGAIIPGAHVVASSNATVFCSEAISNGLGEAVLHMYQRGYDLSVKATGFAAYAENNLEVTNQTHIAVTLEIDQSKLCTLPYDGLWVPYLPLEHSQLQGEISLIPLQQFLLAGKRLRPGSRWL